MTSDQLPRPTDDELVARYHEATALEDAAPGPDLRDAILAQAQVLVDAEIPVEADARVLPVWSNASGKVEALLLLEPEARSSALDRVLSPSSPSLGIGGRVSMDDGSRLRVDYQKIDGKWLISYITPI